MTTYHEGILLGYKLHVIEGFARSILPVSRTRIQEPPVFCSLLLVVSREKGETRPSFSLLAFHPDLTENLPSGRRSSYLR